MSGKEQQISSVIEVTGASKEEAQHLLAACDNDVEAAIAVFFEQGVDLTPAALAASLNNATEQQLEEKVRAPIAPIRQTLVGPEDDNFIAAPPTRLVRLSQRVKVCPLRDFAREGALMEEELQQAASAAAAGSIAMLPSPFDVAANLTQPGQPRRRVSRATEMVTAAVNMPKSNTTTSRLGDLFRPPTDMAYAGGFASARARATELKQWLLVNVQSDNFDSQLLNRDIWSDKSVRKVLRRQFLLWQVDSETTEGRRFVTFYHCGKLPYVCIIDPRTGEEVWKSTDTKQEKFLTDMQQFVRDHHDFIDDDDTPSTSKRSIECIAIDDEDDVVECPLASTSAQATNNIASKKRSKLLDLSEEEQVALAIRNSMRENGKNGLRSQEHGSDDEDYDDDINGSDTSLKEFIEEERKQLNLAKEELHESYESYLGASNNELTMIKLRLLNAEGADEMVQLKWPSDTRLQTIRMYIDQKHGHLQKSNKGYKLICAFPRKPLECEHDLSTLKELGLHPSANLHVTLED